MATHRVGAGQRTLEGARPRGDEVTREAAAERRTKAPDLGRQTDPCCCACTRVMQPGMRYSLTPDMRLRCAACSPPGATMMEWA